MKSGEDTQWPRFEVFLQAREGAAHKDVGSVHAPDAEMALMNARDVFVRRPDCTSLWIVPVAAIFSRTRQELEDDLSQGEAPLDEKPVEYYVFAKHKPAGTLVRVGEITAASPKVALQKARQQMKELQDAQVIWICPQAVVHKSSARDAESLFSPARDKTYRMATDFHTVTAMREIRSDPSPSKKVARGDEAK
jgi:ring-1,2-phenylacetyl-CoA epoxidase subunit PaaB